MNAYQLEVMQLTCSNATVEVGMTAPKLRPETVRENDPVTTAFAGTVVGVGASNDQALYCVPTWLATE